MYAAKRFHCGSVEFGVSVGYVRGMRPKCADFYKVRWGTWIKGGEGKYEIKCRVVGCGL
jgi:hypothetical protein